jgi:hypothetical protein
MDVSGGEASSFPIANMPEKYSTLMQNCYVGENGLVTKVPGYVALNKDAAAESFRSTFQYLKSTGLVQQLVAGGGKIYKLAGSTLTPIKTNLDVSAKVHFAQMNDIVIIGNGVNPPMKYDGTTVSTLGGSPPETGYKPHVHKNRVWWLDKTDKMLAYHSALNNPEDYTGTGSGYIDFKYVLKVGDELVDILTYIDLLVFVFKNHIAIYSGTTPSGTDSDFRLVQLIEGVGAVGTDATVPFGTDLALLSHQGILKLTNVVNTGDLKANSLSSNNEHSLRAVINTITSATSLASVHYKKYGWLLYLIGSTIYGYSYFWKAWFRIVGADANGLDVAGNNLYIPGTGYLYQFDSGYSFNGIAPIFLWKTAWIQIAKGSNMIGYPKILELSHNLQTQVEIGISAEFDFRNANIENVTSFVLGEAPIALDSVAVFDDLNPLDGAVLPYETVRVPLFGKGRLMRLCFSNTSIDGPIELAGFTIFREIGGY